MTEVVLYICSCILLAVLGVTCWMAWDAHEWGKAKHLRW